MSCYLFDFDGTLVDSMPIYADMMLRILDEHQVSYGSDIIKVITPLGYAGAAKLFREMGLRLSQEELVALMQRYLNLIKGLPGCAWNMHKAISRGVAGSVN